MRSHCEVIHALALELGLEYEINFENEAFGVSVVYFSRWLCGSMSFLYTWDGKIIDVRYDRRI